MARTDTLTNYLTDVSNAIKSKTNDASIKASTFDSTISNIENFYDLINLDNMELYEPEVKAGYIPSPATACQILLFCLITTLPKMNLDFSNTSNNSMSYAFSFLHNLRSIDISGFNVHNVYNFRGLFYACKNLVEIDLSSWDVDTPSTPPSSNTNQMSLMFKECTSLVRVDLSCFNGAYNIGEMFNGCTSLEFIDVRGFDLTLCYSATNFLGNSSTGWNVPYNCEIIVADQTQKDWMTNKFPNYTNVKTVAEYES